MPLKIVSLGFTQPGPQARSNLDPTVSSDVTDRALPQTSRGQRRKRERLGIRLGFTLSCFDHSRRGHFNEPATTLMVT